MTSAVDLCMNNREASNKASRIERQREKKHCWINKCQAVEHQRFNQFFMKLLKTSAPFNYASSYLIVYKFFYVVQWKIIASHKQVTFNGVLKHGNCIISFPTAINCAECSSHFHQFPFSHVMARSERELMKVKDKLMNWIM